VNAKEHPQWVSRLEDFAEFVHGPGIRVRLGCEQPQLEQSQDGRRRIGFQDSQRERKPRDGERGRFGEAVEAERLARSGRQAGEQSQYGRRVVKVLGDLVGITAGTNPEVIRGCALRQADRGEAGPFVPAQRGTKCMPRLIGGMRARR
jgi:hypothetical protein